MRICRFLIPFLCLFVPFYSAHAQTCNAYVPASTPDNQLTDNADGTITDTATGLMWKKCLEGVTGNLCETGAAYSFTWQAALLQPGVVNNGGGFAGQTDWRLPNIKELSSIVEEKCYNPSINLTRFPNTPPTVVWSGSPKAGQPEIAWSVYFAYGSYSIGNFRNIAYDVRLVRGGQ